MLRMGGRVRWSVEEVVLVCFEVWVEELGGGVSVGRRG